MELLYDFVSERIIKQPRHNNFFDRTIPLINGIRVEKSGKFFDTSYPIILAEIEE